MLSAHLREAMGVEAEVLSEEVLELALEFPSQPVVGRKS